MIANSIRICAYPTLATFGSVRRPAEARSRHPVQARSCVHAWICAETIAAAEVQPVAVDPAPALVKRVRYLQPAVDERVPDRCLFRTTGFAGVILSPLRNEIVLSVQHWTDELFSFRTTRDKGFRFASGQFTMIGLKIEGKPVLRAYSIASAHYDEELEIFSIKVPDGKLTSRLKDLVRGDAVLVGAKATGTLLLDSLKLGRNLYLLGTGTGLAPFLSLVRDPAVYERFEKVILVHGCRHVRDLAYRSKLAEELPADEILGGLVRDKLVYYPTVTREPFKRRGRISHLIENGTLARDIGLPEIAWETDRFMLCGSVQMLADLRTILERAGLTEGSTTAPGEFVVEKAFVDSHAQLG